MDLQSKSDVKTLLRWKMIQYLNLLNYTTILNYYYRGEIIVSNERMSIYNNSDFFSELSNEWYLATALFDAIDDGNLWEAAALIYKKHANPNVLIPEYNITPIHLAVGHENEDFAKEMTEILLKNGGNPNVREIDGVTPLHVAVVWNRATIVKLLLSCGADPLIADDTYKNAFHYAFEEHSWGILATLEIHRRAEIKKFKNEMENSYNKIQLDRVIIRSNDDAQTEYKTLSSGCVKDVLVAKNTVGIQTPVSFAKVLPAAENNEVGINFVEENSHYDLCEQAFNVILANECKHKITTREVNTSHATDQRVSKLKKKKLPSGCRNNNILLREQTNKCEFVESKNVSNQVENSIRKKSKYSKKNYEIKVVNSNNLVQSEEKCNFNYQNNLSKLRENTNDSSENLICEIVSSQTSDLNSISKVTIETDFDKIENIPYIDKSSSESSLKYVSININKNDEIESDELNSNGNNSEKFHLVPYSNVAFAPIRRKKNGKYVSWSACLKTWFCIPHGLHDSDTSIYYTNTNPDDNEPELRNERRNGIL